MSNKDNQTESEDTMDVVNIPDETGKEVPFEIVKIIEFEDKRYALLHPLEKFKGLDEDSCAIFEVEDTGEDDTINLIPEKDDDILDSVYALYVEWATNVEKNGCSGNCGGCSGCAD